MIKAKKLALKGKVFKTHEEPTKYCRKNRGLFIKRDSNGKIIKCNIKGLGCNSWACPVCQLRKAIKVTYELKEIAKINNLNRFLTLTLDPKMIPKSFEGTSHAYITMKFNHLLTTLRNKYLKNSKIPLKYVWVIEFQDKNLDNGRAHLHIILNRFLPVRLIRYEWKRIKAGIQMKFIPVITQEEIERTVGYFTSYLTKELTKNYENNIGFRFFERRYTASKSCIKPNKKKSIKLADRMNPSQGAKLLNSYGLGFLADLLYNSNEDYKVNFDTSSSLPPGLDKLEDETKH